MSTSVYGNYDYEYDYHCNYDHKYDYNYDYKCDWTFSSDSISGNVLIFHSNVFCCKVCSIDKPVRLLLFGLPSAAHVMCWLLCLCWRLCLCWHLCLCVCVDFMCLCGLHVFVLASCVCVDFMCLCWLHVFMLTSCVCVFVLTSCFHCGFRNVYIHAVEEDNSTHRREQQQYWDSKAVMWAESLPYLATQGQYKELGVV